MVGTMTLCQISSGHQSSIGVCIPLKSLLVHRHLNCNVRQFIVAMEFQVGLDRYYGVNICRERVGGSKPTRVELGVFQAEAGWQENLKSTRDKDNEKELNPVSNLPKGSTETYQRKQRERWDSHNLCCMSLTLQSVG